MVIYNINTARRNKDKNNTSFHHHQNSFYYLLLNTLARHECKKFTPLYKNTLQYHSHMKIVGDESTLGLWVW
jgi:hypothetical protein